MCPVCPYETSYTTVTPVSLVVQLCPSMLHYCHRMLIIPWAHATIHKAKVLLSIIVLTGILSINCFGSILGDKNEIKKNFKFDLQYNQGACLAHPELADSLEIERVLAPYNVKAKFFPFHIIKTIFSRKRLHKTGARK